jgi:hypothetical protein
MCWGACDLGKARRLGMARAGLGSRGWRAAQGAARAGVPGRRDVAARRHFWRKHFDLGYFDQVFIPKLELNCIQG